MQKTISQEYNELVKDIGENLDQDQDRKDEENKESAHVKRDSTSPLINNNIVAQSSDSSLPNF